MPHIMPNGTEIIKVKGEPGDLNPLGTKGTIQSSMAAGELVGYFVKWETMPSVDVFVSDWKIAEVKDNGAPS